MFVGTILIIIWSSACWRLDGLGAARSTGRLLTGAAASA